MTLTEKQVDEQFDKLHKYFRWLICAGLWETWEVLIAAMRADPKYIIRREIK